MYGRHLEQLTKIAVATSKTNVGVFLKDILLRWTKNQSSCPMMYII